MKTGQDFNLGIMFRREYAPEKLPDFARRAEAVGIFPTFPGLSGAMRGCR
jgi:hypothetical protein